ncbi:MAG: PIN domain-containing protein [Halobacteriales archaeon]|nr:PIN domain-containing protein [Halobacteriales archaeon]
MRRSVEAHFLITHPTADDWLNEQAERTLKGDEPIHTSLLAYVELVVEAYEPGRGIDYDVSRVVANLLELVPIEPVENEDVLLAAATFLDEHEVTPFDAFHAGIAAMDDDRIYSSDRVFDELGLERVPLEPED